MISLRAAVSTLLLAAASACSDGTPSTAPSQEDVLSGPEFALIGRDGATTQIRSRLYPDMCLDVPASVYANGTLLVVWPCNTGANQRFVWRTTGQVVPSARQTFCTDAYSGLGRDGDPIGLWGCSSGLNQQWSATTAGEIKGINGKCIGLVSTVRANGTKLTLQTCNGSTSQKWDNTSTTALPAGISILPGQSIQSLVNANPGGTTFILKAGTHLRQNVIPKSGDRFIGEPGAVLDGQGVTAYAFNKGSAPYPSNVTIQGLKITGYVPPFQHGVIAAGGHYPNEGTTGWVIDNNEIAYNGESGIRIGNSTQVTNNNVHHNKRLNIAGSGNNTLIASNVIAFGHYLNSYTTNIEAGGTKFTYTDGLVLRNNTVNDNIGVGIHMDLNNINTIIEGNRIYGNWSEGIAIEISYKTTIRNNTVTNNGWKDPRNRYSWLWNAGIGIHASPNVEVYGNTVSGNYAGIIAIEQTRTEVAEYGPHIVQNLYVHHNTITQTNLPRTTRELSVAAGVATDVSPYTVVFSTTRNNRYASNTYYLGRNPYPFAWIYGQKTEAQWKAYGQDTGGIFNH
jgi:parallel beta-helix repeat protein